MGTGAGLSRVSAHVPKIGAFMYICIIAFKVWLWGFLGSKFHCPNFFVTYVDEVCLTFTLSHSRRIVDQCQQSFSLVTVSPSSQIIWQEHFPFIRSYS